MKNVCPGCGAALPPDAERCDLCGTPVAGAPAAADPADEAPAPLPLAPEASAALDVPGVPSPEADRAGGEGQGVFCPACGQRNPPGARFCFRCGTALPELTPRGAAPPAPPASAPTSGGAAPVAPEPARTVIPATAPAVTPERASNAPGKRALQLSGLALLAVVVLYALTSLLRRDAPPAAPEGPAAGAPAPSAEPGAPLPAAADVPIPVDPAAVTALPLPDSLRGDVASATAVMEGAQRANTAAAWDDAGVLYYRLLLRAPDAQRGVIARQAIAAFQQSLAVEDDPDVRTRLAAAYQYDTQNPMQAIVQLRTVLAASPDHPEANLRMGMMRLQIGRTEEAAESFRRVLSATEPADPLNREAAAQLQALGRLPVGG